MPKKPVVQPQDKYLIRLPDGMRDRIKNAAAKNNRSMNAEIIQVLEDAFPEPVGIADIAKDIEKVVGFIRKSGSYDDLESVASEIDLLLSEMSSKNMFDHSTAHDVEKYLSETSGKNRAIDKKESAIVSVMNKYNCNRDEAIETIFDEWLNMAHNKPIRNDIITKIEDGFVFGNYRDKK